MDSARGVVSWHYDHSLVTSEGSSWGYISLLDDVCFRAVNFVTQSRSLSGRTVDSSSPFSGKHSFGLSYRLSRVAHIGPIHVQRLGFGRAFSSDEAGDGPSAHDVDQASLRFSRNQAQRDSAFRVSEISGLFLNAEGKCGCKAAMQAVLRAAWDLDCRAKLIVVAECDYRRSLDEETYDFWYRRTCWAVTRHKLDHGRAMKVFIAKEIENNITAITWMRRSVVLRCHSDRDDCSLICSHFAHKDDWEHSLFEVI